MIYTPLTRKAMTLAYHAHHGQVDKAGMPYIFHPMHLAEQMEDELSCVCALLHDVVEDTAVTLEALSEEFPPEVIRVLDLLTHREGEDYFRYVGRLKEDPTARKIKLADLAHNSDQSRVAGILTEEQLHYFRQKYQKARDILMK